MPGLFNLNSLHTKHLVTLLVVACTLVGGTPFFECTISNRLSAQENINDEQQVAVPNLQKDRPSSFKKVGIIEFNGPIDYQLTQYFRTRFNQAKSEGVDLLILDINSPGGLKFESLEIAEKLRDCDWAYTVAFVERQAFSGAALVSQGCDEIVISPLASFGDIGVIYFDVDNYFKYAPEKEISAFIRDASTIAESKGHPPELLEAMIDKDRSVYMRKTVNGLEYKVVRVDAKEKPKGEWELIEESGAKQFLTVNGARAVEIGLADTIASDKQELAKEFKFELTEARMFKRTTTDSVVYYLNTSLVTGLLVIIGMVALYFELSAPGLGVGGLISGLCALLFFWSRFLGGTSTWLEVLLFLAGVVFLIVEIFVIPGWGVSGLLGLALVFCSAVMASQDFVVPASSRQWNQLLTTLLIMLCSGCVVIIAAFFITKKFGALPMFNRMILAPRSEAIAEASTDSKTGKPLPTTHPDVSVGDWGKSESLLRPAGRAVFNGRSFDVVSDGSYIQPKAQIKVVEIQGNRIVVTEVEEGEQLAETTYPTQESTDA